MGRIEDVTKKRFVELPDYSIVALFIDTGSYFGSKGESVHQVSSNAGAESIIYVRMEGKYNVIP